MIFLKKTMFDSGGNSIFIYTPPNINNSQLFVETHTLDYLVQFYL